MQGVLKAGISVHGIGSWEQAHTFDLSTGKRRQVDLSISSKSAWSLLSGLGQSEIFVSKKEKEKKIPSD